MHPPERRGRLVAAALVLALLALVSGPSVRAADPMPAPVMAPLPTGTYRLDPAHASLLFRVDHMGMSN